MDQNQGSNQNNQRPSWSETTIADFAREVLKERRASRRWSIFFKLMTLLIIGWIVYSLMAVDSSTPRSSGPHTALVSLDGIIAPEAEASVDRILPALEAAYKDPNTQGIILRINTPGGTAVQSNLIAHGILRLKEKYPETPLVVVVDEMCASGGYYIAAVADQIFVNESSLIGSIGVKLDSFGLTGAMEKLGVERRLLTAGEEKGFLDPFLPLSEKDRQHAQTLLQDMHEQFIDVVVKGRGERLKTDTPDLFSGLVWTGRQSIQIGLADGVGDVPTVAEKVIGAAEVVDFTNRVSVAERLARQLGTSAKVLNEGMGAHQTGGAMMLYR